MQALAPSYLPPCIRHKLFLCSLLPHNVPTPLLTVRCCLPCHCSALNRASSCPCCFPSILFTGVFAAKLDIGVTDMGHSLTALLVTGVHAVSVPIAAPPQGDAQTIQPALELIIVAAARRPCGCRGTGGGHGGLRAPGQLFPSLPSQPPPAIPSLGL